MGFVTLIDNLLGPGFVCFCIDFKRPFKITNKWSRAPIEEILNISK